MFNIGSGELALIAVVALLVLGPRRLPELARGIGKFMREFRRQTDEVRGVVEREFYKMDQALPSAEELRLAPRPDALAQDDAARAAAAATDPVAAPAHGEPPLPVPEVGASQVLRGKSSEREPQDPAPAPPPADERR